MMNDETKNIEKIINSEKNYKIKFKDWLRFLMYAFKNQKYNAIIYTIFLLITASITPIFTYLWTKYIDYATIEFNFKISLIFLIIYVVIKMLVEIFDFLYLRILDKLNCDSWRSLDKTINLKSSSIKYEFYEVPEIQNIINRAWNFSHGEYIELYQNTMYIFKLIFETIGIFISLFLINPIVSLICIITIIPAFITNFIKNKIRILNDIKLTNKYTELDYYENVLLKQDGIKCLLFDLDNTCIIILNYLKKNIMI